jgi:hypothetical protein
MLCFSYIASATTVKERTTAISLFSLAGSTAFVLGPGILIEMIHFPTEFVHNY